MWPPNWWQWVIWGQEESDPTVCPVRPPFTLVISTQRNHWSQALCSQLQTQMNFLKKLATKASNNITGPFLLPRLLVSCEGGGASWEMTNFPQNSKCQNQVGSGDPSTTSGFGRQDSTQGCSEVSLIQTVRTWRLSLGSVQKLHSPRDLCGPMMWPWRSWRLTTSRLRHPCS